MKETALTAVHISLGAKMAEFAGMIEAAGFKRVKHRAILGGAVAMHSGWKI